MRLVLPLLILFVSSVAIGQTDKAKEISNAEKFTERSGTLIKREFASIGEISKCKIEVAYFTDLISNEKVSCIRLEYEYHSSYSTDTKSAHLDADEIDGLLKSISIIQDKIFPAAPANYTEVTYRSRGGFEAGCYSKNEKWKCYLKLEKYDSNSFIILETTDLAALKDLLMTAKSKL